MPKETVRGVIHPWDEEDDARSVVEVRWDRETGYFQMATRRLHSGGEPYYDERTLSVLKKAGVATYWWRPEDVENPPYVSFCSEGQFVDLDRRGINDLIRNLRRARDQAFGRDE